MQRQKRDGGSSIKKAQAEELKDKIMKEKEVK